jgi:hypothetical protein
MVRVKYFYTLFAGMVLMVQACTFNKEELLYEEEDCSSVEISFSGNIFPIVQGNCALSGCHIQGGGAPGLYENYNQVRFSVENGTFQQRVLVTKDMPPFGPLTDCQIELLSRWIEEGMPNN